MLFFIALVIFILYCLNDSNKLYARRRNYHAEHPLTGNKRSICSAARRFTTIL